MIVGTWCVLITHTFPESWAWWCTATIPVLGEAGGLGSLKLAWAAEIKTQQMENQDLFRWFKAESWSSRTIRGHLCSLERQQETLPSPADAPLLPGKVPSACVPPLGSVP